MALTRHPDAETLRRFVLGRLDRRAMVRVESHLRGCPRCTRSAAEAPDDRLVSLLHRPAGPSPAVGADRT